MSQIINQTESNLLREDRIKALYVGWTDNRPNPDFPIWIPIYRMSWDNQGKFYYSYTYGFKNNLDRLKSKIVNPDCGFNQTWATPHIDPIISSRIPHRPDSMKQYDLLGLEDKKGDFIAYLARSGGLSATDNYDVFPEVSPSPLGYYHFYFPLFGLATKIRQGNDLVRKIADSLTLTSQLSLKRTLLTTFVIANNEEIGQIPNYLHSLVGSKPIPLHLFNIVKINPQDRTYGGRIILSLKIKFRSYPYSRKKFQPLNPMPF